MTVIEVSKKKILKALKTEPLYPGSWIKFPGNNDLKKIKINSKNCTVCVVGAVLRNVLNENESVDQLTAVARKATFTSTFADVAPTYATLYQDNEDDRKRKNRQIKLSTTLKNRAIQLIKENHPVTALSYYFEGLFLVHERIGDSFDGQRFDSQRIAIVRKSLISFVENHFPNKIQMDINGALPAEDVKIIRNESTCVVE